MSLESAGVKKETRNDGLEYVKIVPGVEKKLYQLETGESVEVTAKEFTHSSSAEAQGESESVREKSPEYDVVFLPGWAMAADSEVAESLLEGYASRVRGRVFSIVSRTEGSPGRKDPLYTEALAISEFVKEKDLKNVVLVGHSQGGDKAIDLATILQNEVHISGVVLPDSMGLYEQTPASVVGNFIKDGMVNTTLTMSKNLKKNPEAVKQSFRAGDAVTTGIFREIKRSGAASLLRTMDEVTVMARKNPRLAEVSVPVILISGAEDTISNPDEIIPGWDEREKDPETGEEAYVVQREDFLKSEIFSNSPYVRAVFPKKLGHQGLPLFRPESIANASLYLLRRFERGEQKPV